LVNIRVIARGISKDTRVPDTISPIDVAGSHESTEREVYFGLTGEWIKTPVIGRPDIEGWMEGPVVIEEYDSTTIVPPKWRVSLDSSVNITIEKVN
jgi:N-methylhydantoinase A